jgi:hypothetical protein
MVWVDCVDEFESELTAPFARALRTGRRRERRERTTKGQGLATEFTEKSWGAQRKPRN